MHATSYASADDLHWMQLAYQQACLAEQQGEVPVGAVIVKEGKLIAGAYNQPIAACDPSAHAEIQVLRQAGQQLNNYRLPGCELYVTLEPCLMCAGAILHARIARLVYATPDPKTGVAGSVFNVFELSALNHHTKIAGGVMAHECSDLLKKFFHRQRQKG
jgi:tRNA(adenine34) deaminase